MDKLKEEFVRKIMKPMVKNTFSVIPSTSMPNSPYAFSCCCSFSRKRETVIHGEFYPKNVLIHDGIVCPIDWESTAISVGEIDLAALTENWSEEIVQQCKIEYQVTKNKNTTHEERV